MNLLCTEKLRILRAGGRRRKKVSFLLGEFQGTSSRDILRHTESLKKYNKPIFITENGLADARDSQRAWAITQHTKWIGEAIKEGIDVRGYFHWSLLDNFEWSDGFWPRFGLVEVDYKTMERKIRPS